MVLTITEIQGFAKECFMFLLDYPTGNLWFAKIKEVFRPVRKGARTLNTTKYPYQVLPTQPMA